MVFLPGHYVLSLAGLVSFICFVIVVVRMFQVGQTGLGIACLLLLCLGIGGLVAFIMGWVRAREWSLTNVMLVWTVALIVAAVGYYMAPPVFVVAPVQ